MQQLPRATLPDKERGATLIVALIMLILISLLGVSSLKNAAIAEKMAAADHQKNITFQASESAANVSLRTTALMSQALVSGSPSTSTTIDTNSADINSPKTTATVIVAPLGAGALLGNSIAVGGSKVSGERFMITSSTALSTDVSASSETVHGVVLTVPGG